MALLVRVQASGVLWNKMPTLTPQDRPSTTFNESFMHRTYRELQLKDGLKIVFAGILDA